MGFRRHGKRKRSGIDPDSATDFFVETCLRSRGGPPPVVVLDPNATDDPLHGEQEGPCGR